MADLKPITIDDLTRVSREVSSQVFREIIQELVPGMIRHGIDDIRSELSSQGMRLKTVQIDVSQLKNSVRGLHKSVHGLEATVHVLKESVHRLEGLNEEFDERMKADGELIRENLNVRDQVRAHETRLCQAESLQTILKNTVRDHSHKLKSP